MSFVTNSIFAWFAMLSVGIAEPKSFSHIQLRYPASTHNPTFVLHASHQHQEIGATYSDLNGLVPIDHHPEDNHRACAFNG